MCVNAGVCTCVCVCVCVCVFMCVDSEFETETIRNWLSGYKCDKSRICTADLQVVNPEKINKETQTSNDIIVQIDLIDIYRIFHPKTMNFTFFSSAHRTFSRIDHILGHKYSLDKLKKKLKSFQASFLITMW